ncbi:hypothetical protein [Kribbella sp. VKM Ac-2566]|nr:hypothetical protein [Kribbella sp. VKM Ac-2566]
MGALLAGDEACDVVAVLGNEHEASGFPGTVQGFNYPSDDGCKHTLG